MKIKLLLFTLLISTNFLFGQNDFNVASIGDSIKKADHAQTKLPKAKNAFTAMPITIAMQDKDGNIWFGTNGDGLFKYDGKTFTNFTVKDGLANNTMYALLQDTKGNIWVGTRTGLCLYNGKTFTHIPIITANTNNVSVIDQSTQPGVWIMSLMQDKKGTIWLGTENGVYCYKGTNFTLFLDTPMINTDSLHLKGVFSILEDEKGVMWFGSCIGEGFIFFDGKTLQRISPMGYARTQGLVADKIGNMWFASVGKGMCLYNGKSISTNFFKENSTYDLMYLILIDKNDHVWFSDPDNNRNVCYYDGNKQGKFTELQNLPAKNMYPLIEDTLGNIWFAAQGMRLYKWDGKTFINFSE